MSNIDSLKHKLQLALKKSESIKEPLDKEFEILKDGLVESGKFANKLKDKAKDSSHGKSM